MRTRLDRPIVVGLDGSTDSARALRYGVQEARRAGCGLWLVNVIHEIVPVAPMWPLLTSDTLVDVGHELLADARLVVEELSHSTVPVEVETALGPAVQILATASERARMVVLGHRSAGFVERLFTGSTTFGVIARSACPVVSVPHDWDENRAEQRVVAAVDGSSVSSTVLAYAFAAASERSARLEVVHCWRLDPFYSYLVDEWSVEQEWDAQTHGTIRGFIDEWSGRYPTVPVETRLEYAPVADTLVRCSKDADLLVMGRHGHGGLGLRMAMGAPGSVTRAVLQHARCPLAVIPVGGPAEPDDDLVAATSHAGGAAEVDAPESR
ncbi:universal stress protein [Oerskovia turbata]|uniref:Universal stress protein n=1 Tax=Oerskovia turbata TaxID=1713 RepID=A0A4Q1L075_9CELL|nr:universal stress protein [Oerskovia turbata]RXR24752.1 universal stress protein [Oerskovia turbata]RXR35044.1 universal stress protein [Oerskovia turbata]TGJ97110.1 universal stress protein [Actinotalea fermentans ATCC 43279 = JCM 9966 = DSM 3133]